MKIEYIKIKDSKGIYYIADGQVKVKDDFVVPPRRFKQDFKLWFKVTKMTDGKRIYKKKTIKYSHDTNFKSAVLDAEEKKRLLQSSISTNITYKHKSDAELSLDILFDRFMLIKAREIKENTLNIYKLSYNKHIKPTLGDKKLKEVTKYDLNTLTDTMRLNGYKERTVETIKQLLRPLFNYHLQNGDITVNPALQIKSNKLNNEVEMNLTMQEIKTLMQKIEEYPLEPFRGVFIFLSTGRRLNEVLSLRWENVNIEEGFFTITKENNKSSKTNNYPLDERLLNALPVTKKDGYVFTAVRNNKNKLSNTTLDKHWIKLYKSAGIKYLRKHDLRHIIGNVMVSNGANLTEVAELLGHTNTNITKRYSKSDTFGKKRSLDKFFDIVS